MSKQVLVIGLGRLGMAVARALSQRGVEVVGADRDGDRVQKAADVLTDVVTLDATDAEAIARLSPENRDVCVCAIGDDSTESAILCTALLRQAGAKRVVARASHDLQARVLTLVGAHEVVNPLRDFGDRFASRLLYQSILGELPLGDGLVITEMHPPPSLQGKSLADLELPKKHNITVVAIRGADGQVRLPGFSETLRADDVVVVVSAEGAVARLLEDR